MLMILHFTLNVILASHLWQQLELVVNCELELAVNLNLIYKTL